MRAVTSDIKNASNYSLSASSWKFLADIRSLNNYHPYGSLIDAGSWSGSSYNFGYNGMLKEGIGDDVYHTQFRTLSDDRWWSPDPLEKDFPWQSPYTIMNSNPLYFTDKLGNQGNPYGNGGNPLHYMTEGFGQYINYVLGVPGKFDFSMSLEHKLKPIDSKKNIMPISIGVISGYHISVNFDLSKLELNRNEDKISLEEWIDRGVKIETKSSSSTRLEANISFTATEIPFYVSASRDYVSTDIDNYTDELSISKGVQQFNYGITYQQLIHGNKTTTKIGGTINSEIDITNRQSVSIKISINKTIGEDEKTD